MSSFSRVNWRRTLMKQYRLLDVSVREAQYHDFETFANDMSLLLKRRPTSAQSAQQEREQDDSSEIWLRKFRNFAADWGCGESTSDSAAGKSPRSFLDWFDCLTKCYLAIGEAERKQLLDWMSRGAPIMPADRVVSSVVPGRSEPSATGSTAPQPSARDNSEVAC